VNVPERLRPITSASAALASVIMSPKAVRSRRSSSRLVPIADLPEVEAEGVVERQRVLDEVGADAVAGGTGLGAPVHGLAAYLVVRRELVRGAGDARIADDVLVRPRAARHREAEPLAVEH